MREGLIPTIIGTAVVASGVCMERKIMQKARKMEMLKIVPLVTAGVIGFGLAHIVLGSIDLFSNNDNE